MKMALSALPLMTVKSGSALHGSAFPCKSSPSRSPFACFWNPPRVEQAVPTSLSVEERNEVMWGKPSFVGVGIGILAASIVSLVPLCADATRIEYYATVEEPECDLTFARSGLGFCDIVVGSGAEAPYAELINVHYTARFADGTVFDSSYKRGRPLTMRIGVGKVISGLDQGIFGGDGVPPMHVGGTRKLQIPPSLAYGPEPAGCFSGDCNIPGDATLLYDIKFVELYSGNRKFTPIQ